MRVELYCPAVKIHGLQMSMNNNSPTRYCTLCISSIKYSTVLRGSLCPTVQPETSPAYCTYHVNDSTRTAVGLLPLLVRPPGKVFLTPSAIRIPSKLLSGSCYRHFCLHGIWRTQRIRGQICLLIRYINRYTDSGDTEIDIDSQFD